MIRAEGPWGVARIAPALQALRVAAMLLVVAGHGAISYTAAAGRVVPWLVYDPASSVGFDWLCYWVNGIAMPVFFLLAGLFSAHSYEARGPWPFLGQRARRLFGPLLLGLAAILPLTYLIWAYGFLASGRCSLHQVLRLKFDPALRADLCGPGHLWFLEYLILLTALFWIVQRWRSRWRGLSPARGWTSWLLRSPWKPLLLALPTAVVLWPHVDAVVRLRNSFLPDPVRLLYEGLFFLAGVWLTGMRRPERCLLPWSRLYLLLSMPVLVGMVRLFQQHLSAPLHGPSHLALVALASLFPWLSVFGALGLFVRYCQRRQAVLSYLAEASLWIYLAHVPLVGLMQVLLLPLPWPPLVKFLVVEVVAVAGVLGMYPVAVRSTFLGLLLNGRRREIAPAHYRRASRRLVAAAGLLVVLLAVGGACYFHTLLWGNNLHAVIPGQVYRSAQPTPRQLEQHIRRLGLRSVICLRGDSHFAAENQVCQAHGVDLYILDLSPDRVPDAEELEELATLLRLCRRPLLVHGAGGGERTALAAAVAELLDGRSPAHAVRQFRLQYGHIGGPGLAVVVSRYQAWLVEQGMAHTPEHFRAWVSRGGRREGGRP